MAGAMADSRGDLRSPSLPTQSTMAASRACPRLTPHQTTNTPRPSCMTTTHMYDTVSMEESLPPLNPKTTLR